MAVALCRKKTEQERGSSRLGGVARVGNQEATKPSNRRPEGPEEPAQKNRQPNNDLTRDVSRKGPQRVEENAERRGGRNGGVQHEKPPCQGHPGAPDEPTIPRPGAPDNPGQHRRLPPDPHVQENRQKRHHSENQHGADGPIRSASQ